MTALTNNKVAKVASGLEEVGYEVFSDWLSPGPDADVFWQKYETLRGRKYQQAIDGPTTHHVFRFDRHWLDWCDVAVLVLPAGKSGHLELGYVVGAGKRGFILMDGELGRWDVYRFSKKVCMTTEELLEA